MECVHCHRTEAKRAGAWVVITICGVENPALAGGPELRLEMQCCSTECAIVALRYAETVQAHAEKLLPQVDLVLDTKAKPW